MIRKFEYMVILCLFLLVPWLFLYPLGLTIPSKAIQYNDSDLFQSSTRQGPKVNLSQGIIAGTVESTIYSNENTCNQIYKENKNSIFSTLVGLLFGTYSRQFRMQHEATCTSILGSVESFRGIPYAKPPVGDLRFRSPVKIRSRTHGIFDASNYGPACPQMVGHNRGLEPVLEPIWNIVKQVPILKSPARQDEDCLTINVQRPKFNSISKTQTYESKFPKGLPVVIWIFGGAFEIGDTKLYNGVPIVERSISMNMPIIFVSFNYRLNALGFLPGSEVFESGDTNVGLRDQELAIAWVKENIKQFGGDPENITMIGQSAGAMSISYHLLRHKSPPPFQRVILHSGFPVPLNSVNSTQAQQVYNQLVNLTGCDHGHDNNTLECLRMLPIDSLQSAINKYPSPVTSYNSLLLPFLPRQDYDFIPESPNKLLERSLHYKIPIIAGTMEDEGTLFSLGSLNITKSEELEEYMANILFPHASQEQIKEILGYYDSDPTKGSPFHTGYFSSLTPQNKRIAAILGDVAFQAPRRLFLNAIKDTQPTWSFMSRFFKETPLLGSFHTSDLLYLFELEIKGLSLPQSKEIQTRWISFAHTSDPNFPGLPYWPTYDKCIDQEQSVTSCLGEERRGVNMEWNELGWSRIKNDTFRWEAIDYLQQIAESLAP